MMQGGEEREMEWPPPREALPFLVAEETPPEEYGPWQWAQAFGRATGLLASRCLCVAREREAALSSGGKPVVERSASRECLHPTGRLPGLPDRLSVLLSAGAVLGKRRPKAIGHVAKVASAVS